MTAHEAKIIVAKLIEELGLSDEEAKVFLAEVVLLESKNHQN